MDGEKTKTLSNNTINFVVLS